MVLQTHADHKPPSILHETSVFSNTPDNCTLTYTKGKVVNTQFASAMAVNNANAIVAIGGRERDVNVLDLKTCQTLWKAKNLPPDPQTLLQQPIWPSAMQFLSTDDNNSNHNNLLAVGTAFGQVRLYDVRSQPAASILRRPIRYTPLREHDCHRITALCQTAPHQIVLGDTTGDMHALDLRFSFNGQHGNKQIDGTATSLGRFVGPAGSIRSLQRHPTLPILAVVGCDRILRTYNVNTHKIIDCVYLKQRLNCVLMTPEEGRFQDETNEEEEDGDDENANRYGSDGDMDQEDDIVEDFVDSSDDDDDNGNSGGKKKGGKQPGSSDSDSDSSNDVDDVDEGKNGAPPPASHDDDDDDDSPAEDGEGENDYPRGNRKTKGGQDDDSESDSAESEEEEESSEEDEAPKKKRRR